MGSITESISSLNDLYLLYIESNRDPVIGGRIRELADRIKQQGFVIRQVDRNPNPEEVAFLTGKGRRALRELNDIQQQKTTAILRGEFERAADLRDLENELRGALWEKITHHALNQFFVLFDNEEEIIVFGRWPSNKYR